MRDECQRTDYERQREPDGDTVKYRRAAQLQPVALKKKHDLESFPVHGRKSKQRETEPQPGCGRFLNQLLLAAAVH